MSSLSTKIDKRALNAFARQEEVNLRSVALGEAIRVSNGNPSAKDVVRDAKVFYDFLRGRK